VAERSPVVRLRQTLLSVHEVPTAVVDAIELRDHLEVLVDLGAARCRSEADIEELRVLLARMRSAADWDSFMQANWALHERIAGICPNAMARGVYIGTLGHLSSSSSELAEDSAASEAYRERRYAVHVDLVEAVASGDEDRVRAAVARHNVQGALS
jgi:DNA-binding FadR family transcriptional regulator